MTIGKPGKFLSSRTLRESLSQHWGGRRKRDRRGISTSAKTRRANIERRLQTQSLEARQLLAGPELVGIQPNSGQLIQGGTSIESAPLFGSRVLQTAPNELTFRFDDNSAIDPATLLNPITPQDDTIRPLGLSITRSGADGAFETATAITDLGTSGNAQVSKRVEVEFRAASTLPGVVGNGTQVFIERYTPPTSVDPVIRFQPVFILAADPDAKVVRIGLNTLSPRPVDVRDLTLAVNNSSAASQVVRVDQMSGDAQTAILGTLPAGGLALTLDGANTARAVTDLQLGQSTSLEIAAKQSGAAGTNLRVVLTSQNFGGATAPLINISNQTINVRLNSAPGFQTTVGQLLTALNSNPTVANLVTATLRRGNPNDLIGGRLTPTPGSNGLVLPLTGASDTVVTPGFVGLGDRPNEVVFRFAEALPEDTYQIEIYGSGDRALRNTNDEAFNGGEDFAVQFEINTPPRVLAVVPEPVTKDNTGRLISEPNVVEVYFTGDVTTSGAGSILNAAYYDAIYTRDTVTPNDDGPNADGQSVSPIGVELIPGRTDAVRVIFESPFARLPDPTNAGSFVPGAVRLRVGNDSLLPNQLAPQDVTPSVTVNEAGDSIFADADQAGPYVVGAFNGIDTSRTAGIRLTGGRIENTTTTQDNVFQYPGGTNYQGVRDIRPDDPTRDTRVVPLGIWNQGGDQVDGIQTIYYNFPDEWRGDDLNTQNVDLDQIYTNSITEQQRQRVREVAALFSEYLGVQFIEVGQDAASAISGPDFAGADGPVYSIAVGSLEGANDGTVVGLQSAAGGITVATRGLDVQGDTFVGSVGLTDSPNRLLVLDGQDFDQSTDDFTGGEFFRGAFLGIGQLLGYGYADHLPQPITQSASGVLDPFKPVQDNLPATTNDLLPPNEALFPSPADIVNGQFLYRPESNDIDLYEFTLANAGTINISTIAERLGTSSQLDTMLRLYRIEDGKPVEIAANDDYFSNDSLIELEVQPGKYVVGVSASGNDQYDPIISGTGSGGVSQGDYELAMSFTPTSTNSITDGDGLALDGDSDGQSGGVFQYWFEPNDPNTTLYIDNTTGSDTGNGNIVSPYRTLNAAFQAVEARRNTSNAVKVVRVVGEGTYRIGSNQNNGNLTPGEVQTVEVPKGVNLVLDAGVRFEMSGNRIGVGSTTVGVDRSGATIQVLGTPDKPVELVGIGQSNPGTWGGIDIRGDIDFQDDSRENLENNGIFLNHIQYADIQGGGGRVAVDGVSRVVSPIELAQTRATILNNTITRSSDAAIAATPDTFLETRFDESRFQTEDGTNEFFTSDFVRVGPHIRGNTVIDNTYNGLLIRIETPAGGSLETLNVNARFDDTDIVHILSENLLIEGTPGGASAMVDRPSVANVTTLPRVNTLAARFGDVPQGEYGYRITFVTSDGFETVASDPIGSVTLSATGSITLGNLPTVSTQAGFTGRRVYRAPVIGTNFDGTPVYGDFLRVARLNPSTTTFIDTQLAGTTQIADSLIGENALAFTGRLDPGLTVDPGTIVKLDGARIDVTFGARLFAEGTDEERVVFTSLNDRRFGAGGTFNTNGQFQDSTAGALTSFNAGDWSGIYLGFGADGSFDHTVFAGGGGTSQVEGGFASFNVIEAHQSDLRIANSRFENNEDGRRFLNDSGNDVNNPDDPREQRANRVNNAAGTVFVRGSQPTILNNTFVDGQGPTLSFDVNSFTWQEVTDPGRSTGSIDQLPTRGNSGPLIQGNRMEGGLSGVEVRGGAVATEVVWDDTDIVHIVRDTIEVPNQHIYGGLRLESDSRASLVVKFENQTTTATTDDPLFNRRAGIVVGGNIFTAEDQFTGIADRIGGSLQVIGQPDFPVVLTALSDDAVGAGFTPDGRANVDTDNNGIVLNQRTAVELNQRLPPRLPVSREFAEVDQEVDLGRQGNNLDPTVAYNIDNDIDVNNQRGHLEASIDYGGLFERVEFTGENSLTGALIAANLEFLNTNYINVTPDLLPFIPNPAPVQLADAFLPDPAGGNPVEIELAGPDRVVTTGIYDIDYELAGSPAFGVQFPTIFARQIRWRAETFILDNRGTIYTTLDFETVDELPFDAGRVRSVDVINYNDPGTPGLNDNDNILFQVGTPGEADFRLVTVDDDNGLAFAHGGVYENDSFNQVNAQYSGFSTGAAGANKFVLNNIQQDTLVTAVSSDIDGVHFQDALGYLPIAVEPIFETVTPGTFAIGLNGGPADIDTAHQWRLNNSSNTARVTSFVEFIPSDPAQDPIEFNLPSPIPGSGTWDGIVIREAASDSNASITSENEPSNVGDSDTNSIASRSQFLGEVAPNRKSGDENRRLGLIVDGEISSSSDVDVYSFVAEAGTQVWLDIDRTDRSLDTVVELVNSNGQTIVLSDDAFAEARDIERLLSLDPADPATAAERAELLLQINSRTGRGSQAIDSGSIFGLATGQLDAGEGLVPFQDQYSINSRDAGMRIILPGIQGVRSVYHVRVRSSITPTSKSSLSSDNKNRMIVGDTSNVIDNEETLRAMTGGLRLGATEGSYQLQIRVEEQDVFAGTQVRYSDILYADNGIQVVGGPLHSPLAGTNYEIDADNDPTTSNDTLSGAQRLGLYDTHFVNGALVDNPADFANVTVNPDGSITIARNGVDIVLDNPAGPLGTDRLATNISGFIDDTADVDWYEFEINYSQLTRDGAEMYLATVFDLDYTDGLGRADLALHVFNAAGELVLIGGDSNIADDLSLPGTGGATDLSRGSFGNADPFIGSAELPEGTYYVAVSNQGQVPVVLDQFNNRDATNPLIRLEPIDSTRRIAEEGFTNLGVPTSYTQVFEGPITPVLFDQNSIIDYSLDDVFLYVNSGSNLFLVNPFTGTQYVNLGNFDGQEIRDVAFTANGELFAYTQYDGPAADDSYAYVRINTVTGAIEEVINDGAGIATFNDQDVEDPPAQQILDEDSDVGLSVEAITIRSRFGNETGFFVGNRPGGASAVGLEYNTNILYAFDEQTGLATGPNFNLTLANAGAGTDVREIGQIDTTPPQDVNGNPTNVANVLGLSDATELGVNGQGVPQIFDGDTFTLFDGTNVVTFEFNQGFTLVSTDPASIPNGTLVRVTPPGRPAVTFELTNSTPTSASNIVVPIDRASSATRFTQTLATIIQGRGIAVSTEGTQLALPAASSVELISPTLAQVNGLTLSGGGTITPGNAEVTLFPTDTAEVIAQRIVQTVAQENNAGRLANVSATARGRSVLFTALVQQVVTQGSSLRAGGQPNGGLITGLETVGANLFAISNTGGLYRVDSSSINALGSNNNVGVYVDTATDLLGIPFTGLRAGPNSVEGGRFADLLFATAANGRLYAFNTAGELQNIFAGGQSSVPTGIFNAQGLDFATLDYNLWHVTGARGDDAGHGINEAFHGARPQQSDGRGTSGNNSLVFNYTTGAFNGNYGFGEAPVRGFNNGVPTNPRQDGQDVQSTYNFPGGARGTVQSNAFSLAGYSPADVPTMYFNYFLNTDGVDDDSGSTNPDTDLFQEDRDTLRVYVIDSNGVEHLVATNNEARGPANVIGVNDEFDDPNTGIYADNIDVDVQQLYDNTGTWRQARVPLGVFAGQEGLALRIEFSTAGTTITNTAEIRTVAASELTENDTFVIGGETFSIDLAPAIVFPSGRSLADLYADPTALASFEIDGQTYYLNDGTRTAAAEARFTNPISIDLDVLNTPLSQLTSGDIANAVADSFDRELSLSRVVPSGTEIDLFYQDNPVPVGTDPQLFYNQNPELLPSLYLNGIEYVFIDEDSDRQNLTLPVNTELFAPRVPVDLIAGYALLNPNEDPLVDISTLTRDEVAEILALVSGELDLNEPETTIDYGQLVPSGNILDTLYADPAALFVVTIDGIEYALVDNNRVASANQVPVALGSNLQNADIGGALRDAVEANTNVAIPSFRVVSQVNFSDRSDPIDPFGNPNTTGNTDRNDLIFQATPLDYDGGSVVFEGRGTIGTFGATTVTNRGDVDLISVRVEAGTEIVVSVDADQPGVDNAVRFFDSSGSELVSPAGGPLAVVNDARGTITLTAPQDGLYYIGVSGPENANYDPRIEGTTDAAQVGGYDLTISIEAPLGIRATGALVEFAGVENLIVNPNAASTLDSILDARGVAEPDGLAVTVSRDATATEVAIAVQRAVANRFYEGDISLLPRAGSALRLPGLIAPNDPLGPFISTSERFGDQFGGDFRGGAADNAAEGAYIDDIIIGFAERGELVTASDPIDPDAAFVDFGDTALTTPNETRRTTDSGSYQLEIRDASEYVASGQVLTGGFSGVDARFRTFDTNDRLADEGVSLTTRSASEIVDGATFILSGQNQRLTFEFDVEDGDGDSNGIVANANRIAVRLPAEATAEEVADLVIARINAPDVRPILGIIASRANLTRVNTSVDVPDRNLILIGADSFRTSGTGATAFESTLEQGLRGDSNRDREEQGVIMIESSRIIYSEDNGVQILRNAAGNIISEDTNDFTPNILPSPRNFAELNTENYLPGVVLRNNTFAFNQNVGIDIIGLENGGAAANNPVGFDRVVNNTLIGGSISRSESLGSQVFGATFFPMGGVSFADSVLDSETIFGDDVEQSFRDSEAALGSPDCHGLSATDPADGLFTFSLGSGGRATFVFEDNLLTGSSSDPGSTFGAGDGIADLIIFESGLPERVGVEVSRDNQTYFNVGEIFGLDNTIDLDAFGFGLNDRFSYVRLTDLTPAGTFNFGPAGADIDAIGALSTIPRDEFTPGRIGIQVDDNAAPTLLNNVFANFQTGVSITPVPFAATGQIDVSSVQTVIGGSTYYRNNEASRIPGIEGVGINAQFLDDLDAVFVDPFNLIFTPQSRTPIIDSGLASLEDRPSLIALRDSLGLPESPVLAPRLDANGQTRVDDSTFDSPFGTGASAFVDRGAEERTDNEGPRFVLTSPRGQDLIFDNAQGEFGRSITRGTIYDAFEIQLIDGIRPADSGPGVGVNDNTVTSENLLVTRLIANGDSVETLQEGVDYRFSYEPGDNIIRITPIAGIWTDDSVYTIEFIGSQDGSVDGFTSVLQGRPGISYGDGQKNFVDDAILETDLGIQLSIPSDALIVTDALTGISRPAIGEQTVTIFDGINPEVTFEFVTDLTTPITNGRLDFSGNYAIQLPTTASPQLIVRLLARRINEVAATGVLNIEAVHRDEPAAGQTGRLQLLGDGVNADEAFVRLEDDSVFRQVNQELDVQLLTQIEAGPNGERLTNYDGQQIVVFDGTSEILFEFDTDDVLTAFGPDVNGVGVSVEIDSSPRELVQALLAAFRENELDVAAFGATGVFRIRGTNGPISVTSPTGAALVTGNSEIGVSPGFGLQIPVADGELSAAVQDGQSFTIGRGLGTPVTFELDFDSTPLNLNARQISIPGGGFGNTTPDQVADAIAQAVNQVFPSLAAANVGNGRVTLGNEADIQLNTAGTTLTQIGSPGDGPSTPVVIRYNDDANTVAAAFADAAIAAGIDATLNDTRVLLRTTSTPQGDAVVTNFIADKAGNRLQPGSERVGSRLEILVGDLFDYGDAVEPYNSTLQDGGPRHQIVDNLYLGTGVTADVNGVNDDADNDDGVVQLGTLRPGFGTQFQVDINRIAGTDNRVSASQPFYLDAWFDWNGDGVFGTSEVTRFGSLGTGLRVISDSSINTIVIDVPSMANLGDVQSRFRLSYEANLGPNGIATAGEVEDYQYAVSDNPFQNSLQKEDVNNSKAVTPLDALLIINMLNANNGSIDLTNVPAGLVLPAFPDVDGNGTINAVDALRVINFLNTTTSPGVDPTRPAGEPIAAGEPVVASVYQSVGDGVMASPSTIIGDPTRHEGDRAERSTVVPESVMAVPASKTSVFDSPVSMQIDSIVDSLVQDRQDVQSEESDKGTSTIDEIFASMG